MNQISLKTEQISFQVSVKAGTKVIPNPNHTRQILNQTSPKFSYFAGEVLPFLQSKGTFALAPVGPTLLFPQDFTSGQFLNCGYVRGSLEERSLGIANLLPFPAPASSLHHLSTQTVMAGGATRCQGEDFYFTSQSQV